MTDLTALANTAPMPHNQAAMCCVGFLMIWIVGLFVIMLIFYLLRKQKQFFYVAIISAILVLCGIGAEVYLYEDQVYRESQRQLKYFVELDSSSDLNEVVYLPVSLNIDLQKDLKVTSGTGTIRIIETRNGTALEVNFTGSISISGHLDTTEDIGDNSLSMECSTSDHYESTIDHWIYYSPANDTAYNCSFHLKKRSVSYWSMPVTFEGSGYLTAGWNRYPIELDAPD